MSEETAQGATETTATASTGDNEVKALKAEAAQRRVENKELKEQLESILAGQKADEEAKLVEKEEFKTLAEKLAEEKAKLEEQLAGQAETLGKIKERDEAKLKTLLEAVPDNLRESIANNSGTLAEKIDLAEKLKEIKPSPPGARPAGTTSQSTLDEQYNQAVRDGNIGLQISLKSKMFEKG